MPQTYSESPHTVHTEAMTVGTDATVYVWFFLVQKPEIYRCSYGTQPWQAIGFYAEIQIRIFFWKSVDLAYFCSMLIMFCIYTNIVMYEAPKFNDLKNLVLKKSALV